MITVKNRLNQIITYSVPKGSLHFLPRENKELSEEDFKSEDIQRAVRIGDMIVIKMQ